MSYVREANLIRLSSSSEKLSSLVTIFRLKICVEEEDFLWHPEYSEFPA